MAERIIWGVVSPKGEILSGTGFLVDHANTGIYTILFKDPFNVVPAVSVTQIYPNDIHNHTGGDTRDNAVLIGIVNDRFKVKTGGSNGAADNRNFSFVAIGI